MGKSFADFPPISLPQQQWAHRIPNPLLQAEQYNVDKMATLVDEQRAIYNPDQVYKGDWSGTLQEIPQLNYTMEYVTTHLQEIPQRIR